MFTFADSFSFDAGGLIGLLVFLIVLFVLVGVARDIFRR